MVVVNYDINIVFIKLSHLFNGNLVSVSGLYQLVKHLKWCDVAVINCRLPKAEFLCVGRLFVYVHLRGKVNSCFGFHFSFPGLCGFFLKTVPKV